MWRLLAFSLVLFAPPGANAQSPAIQVHPKATDLAIALQTIDVVFTRIEKPLTTLSADFDGPTISAGMQARLDGVRDLSRKWSAIITVSSGKEMPTASDLFFIYTEALDIQSYGSALTSEDRLRGKASGIAQAAVNVVHGNTELASVSETLRYAVADRIDAQEAKCRKGSSAPK